MFIKGLLIAGATGLMSSVAFAQDAASPQSGAQAPTTVNPAPSMPKPSAKTPSSSMATPAPAATSAGADVVAISPDLARAEGVPVQMVASAPVPDTPENRAKYGGPMSVTGKRTVAKGN
jgi:hypothetical protein